MKLLFPKQNYNVLSLSSYTYISVRDLCIFRIGLPILLQGNMWTDPVNIQIDYRHMNVEIGTEECINGIFLAVWIRHARVFKLGLVIFTLLIKIVFTYLKALSQEN